MQVLKSVYGVPAPQSEPIVGREAEMVRNAAGGYVFPVTDWTRFERFLILGSDAGTYYASARALTTDNAAAVRRCLDADGQRAVQTLVDISTRGRAPRNEPALFALAMAASFGDAETRRAAGPALTRLDILRPLADKTRAVTKRLTDSESLRKARVHPLALLVALRTYGEGRSQRGSSTWKPVPEVVDALERACVLAFDDLEPIRERVYLAVDVSGSMGWSQVAGLSNVTAREAAAAMAMVIARQADRHVIKGFSAGRNGDMWYGDSEMHALPITRSSTLREAVQVTSDLPFGATDCALPMLDALEHGIEADAFVVLTDNETWAGEAHPSEALRRYRRKTGIPAQLVVVAMTATECSIADPEDAGMLDVVGFDTAAPNVIQDFLGRAAG